MSNTKLMIKGITKNLMATGVITLSLGVTFPVFAQSFEEKEIESSVESEEVNFRITQLVSGLEHPWGMGWLPDGRMLVTERPGRIQLIDPEEGTIKEIGNLPEIDTDEDQLSAPDGGNQGGLLDIVVHPNYEQNGWIYFTFSSPGDDDAVKTDDEKGTGTALGRAKLNSDESELEDVEILYVQSPRTEPGRHYGSRIVFPGDGTVVFSIGDRGIRYPSQDLTDPAGSMIRLNEDGGAAEDNPFVNKAPGNLRPEIFSFGHRNNQGIIIHPETGDIWTTEHGPYGGDLLHKVEAGKNYGWPQVAQGVEYDTKQPVGIGKEAPGVEKPKYVWDESMAPSGLAIHHNGAFSAWEGNLFAGALLTEKVYRLVLDGDEISHAEELLTEKIGRIRDVRQGPDGKLYFLTDEGDGGVYSISPVD